MVSILEHTLKTWNYLKYFTVPLSIYLSINLSSVYLYNYLLTKTSYRKVIFHLKIEWRGTEPEKWMFVTMEQLVHRRIIIHIQSYLIPNVLFCCMRDYVHGHTLNHAICGNVKTPRKVKRGWFCKEIIFLRSWWPK